MSRPRTHKFTLEKNGARISVEHSGLHRLTANDLKLLWATVESNVLPVKPTVLDPATVICDMLEDDARQESGS